MISLKKILFAALVTGISADMHSQYITIDESQTVEQLVEDVLVNNPCANVSNISVTGLNFGSGNSYGYFAAGTSGFPFAEGIVLSTGRAASAPGPNSGILSEGPTDWEGDDDLEDALSVNNTINATVIEFDFLPLANKISFDYIFSSEQYLTNPSSNQCSYTDGFAFLLKEANSSDSYQNLALVPNTNTPVKVSTVRGSGTVCPPANEEYFGGFNGFDHPTNYNGQTVVLTAEATVIPNTLYHIKLVIADQGNNLYDSAIFLGGGSFKVQKDLGPDRLLATNNPLCPNETLTLDATEPGTNTYQWFQNDVAIPGAVNPTYTVDAAGTYSVEISLDSTACVETGEITIEYGPSPVVTSPVSIIECDADNDGSAVFDLTQISNAIASGANVAYYESLADAQNDDDPITNLVAYAAADGTQLFAAVVNQYGCLAFSVVNLEISNQTVSAPDPIEICDTDSVSDGIAQFNLDQEVTPYVMNGLPSGLNVIYYNTAEDAESQVAELPNLFTNTNAGGQIIYARIVNGPDCFGVIPVTLVVNTFNPVGFGDVTVFICNGVPTTLQAPSGYQYQWSNGTMGSSISVSAAGNYSVTATNADGCSVTKTFTVIASEAATFVSADIRDFLGNQNSVLINYSGNGDYVFSLDGENFQASPTFSGLLPGEYSVYIRDENGCGIVGPYLIYVLGYPDFFTPNGDGFNDYWGIEFPDSRNAVPIYIYDRYGKLLHTVRDSGSRWDGTFNSKQLPSTDYWFRLKLQNGRLVNGHFSLKR